VNGIEIKEEADYPGVRLTGFTNLAKARIPFQIDIGYGDAVSPGPEEAQLPSFLDFPSPQLRVYPVYVVIAEKFQKRLKALEDKVAQDSIVFTHRLQSVNQ